MEHSDKQICRACGELKDRKCIGEYDSGRNRKYVDENGKLWNGKKCPACQVVASRANMFKLRELRKPFKVEDAS